MIQDSYFFSDLIEANVCNENFLPFLEEYSNQIQKQVYAIYRALPTKNTYNYKEACVLLIPHKKIILLILIIQMKKVLKTINLTSLRI